MQQSNGYQMAFGAAPLLRRGVGGFGGGGGGSGGGHVRPDCESAGLAQESADPAWRQIDLLRRKLEEEDGSHDVPPNN